jgi:xylulokinase
VNYIGIDIGSSGCKALAVTDSGVQRALAHRDYEVSFSSDGGATLNSDEVIEKCFSVIKECADRLEPNSVRGIGISSQGEAFTALGSLGEALCPAMVSSDTTSQGLIRDWVRMFGEEKLYQITGHTPHPMFTVFKLLRLKNTRPDVWQKSRFFLCFEDLLQMRLGLSPTISWSLAGRTLMFDVRKKMWDADILDRIPVRPDQLAAPLPPGDRAGFISRDKARMLGLPDDVTVVTGGHDQTCCALGAGVANKGVAMLGTGTVECICGAFDKPVFSRELQANNLCTYNFSLPELYSTVAFSLTGGNIFKWFKDQLGSAELDEASRTGQDVYSLLLKNMDGLPSPLLVLPYFTASGTPYFDTQTKGAIIGLQLSTRRKDILKALLEGVSFEMRLNLEILESAGWAINDLRWVGGGSKSELLARIKANVMNKPITMLNVNEAGCFGAAMLACAADTGEPIRNLASTWVKPLQVIAPQQDIAEQYSERFTAYKQLYASIKAISF